MVVWASISLFEEHSFESVFVEVLINNAVNIIVGEIYRVPNSNRQLSIQYYEDIISNSAVHYVIWRDFFVQIELGVEIANLGGE